LVELRSAKKIYCRHNEDASEQRNQLDALEAALAAARREADALREQLQLFERRKSAAASTAASTTASAAKASTAPALTAPGFSMNTPWSSLLSQVLEAVFFSFFLGSLMPFPVYFGYKM
jgi:VIT1/CCC1 family predicted Fe2+/Mn2+ transporter